LGDILPHPTPHKSLFLLVELARPTNELSCSEAALSSEY
jgi:hypothetical protein